jgi:asparagine synthase (glutamine-hydrolysing)
MCGIVGYTQVATRLPRGVLSGALESLRHRGPNQQNEFISGQIALGVVRLRILDLAGGDQPFVSEDGDVVVVFNGEVFNHEELRRELQDLGHDFRTRCDTEVVLRAFLQWGSASFARMRGMFAIAVWEKSRRRLTLARDRVGVKPLYYRLHRGEIFFGSELKCILAHPDVPRHICLEGLNCFLSLNYVPGPYTLIQGITKLMPGHLLEWQHGSCTVRPYVPAAPAAAPPRCIEEACAELDTLLKAALAEQLVADVPVGIWLSGGLDSSTVLHYAAAAGAPNLRTFSITFQGHSFDESGFMNEVVSRYGTHHSEFDLNPSADLVGAIEQIAYYSDEPSADAGALPVWFLAQMTSRHVTAVLSGEGADELFGGYLTYQADRYNAVARRVPSALRKLALRCAAWIPVSDEKIGFDYKLKRFLYGSLLTPDLAHIFWNGTFSDEEKSSFFRFADPSPLARVLSSDNATSGLARYLDFDQRYYLPDDILYKVDRMSMAHSLEARPPFLDPRIVDFAARLPARWKLRGRTSKYVLRRLMQDKLPPSILRRPKIGFDIPVHQWFRGALRPFLLDTLSSAAVARTGLFRAPAVEELIRAHLERRANLGYHLWGLMVLLVWMRKWNVELGPLEALLAEAATSPDEVGSSSLRLVSSLS